mgnify:CR=1 FL=1
MDFNHFVIDHHMAAPWMAVNNDEIAWTQNEQTYMQDVTEYRGERVPLPKLGTLQNRQASIGVGTNDQAIDLQHIKAARNRTSSVKTAFGDHAKQSAIADVAQGCGTTGRGNIHLFGQAAINQWAPPALRFSQEETQVYLSMVATVMTADGGHTLSETLGTAYIAARNVGQMTQPAKSLVADMFAHMSNITTPMSAPETRFGHYDTLMASVQDPDTHNRLAQAWDNVAFRP